MARPRRPALHPRLAEFRARSGLTQEQVAEAVGITAEMVRRHEKGLSRPIELYRKRYVSLYRASEAEPKYYVYTARRTSFFRDGNG